MSGPAKRCAFGIPAQSILILASVLAPLGIAQRAAIGAQGQPLSLPDFDVRMTPQGATPAVHQAVLAARAPAAVAARAREADQLAAAVTGLRVRDDQLFGTPHFVGSTRQLLTAPAPAGRTPRDVVRDFVAAWPALFEVEPGEIDAARVARDLRTRHNGATHLTLQQQVDGMDIRGAELKASVTGAGELVNVSSTLLPRPAGGFPIAAPALGPLDALERAAASVGIALGAVPVALDGPAGASRRQAWSPVPGLRPSTAVTSELLVFPLTRTELHPAWLVVVPEPGIGNTYEIIVDALDGAILRRSNRLHSFGSTQGITFNVFPLDSPAPGSPGTATPNSFQFPVVPRVLVKIKPADVAAFSPDSWIDDGMNETLGNNVDAHSDLDADDLPDLPRPHGSPFRVFDFPLDLTKAPGTYVDAAVTQLFYYCNRFHDRLYALGFDEAAGNFQDDNFGKGGLGGDRLLADAQDASFTNNAWFLGDGVDGSEARIEMFVWDGPIPDRDGDLDGDIVYHECAHGLSTRLSGGTLDGEQSSGMGEGWSDFFAIALNAEPGDDPEAVYTVGAYARYRASPLFTTNYYYGIRRFPYSTNLNKSPLTYADIDPAQFAFPASVPTSPLALLSSAAEEAHNVGEVWCQALLECRANIWGGIGFKANELVLQLVVDGLKLMPSHPSFLDARDAILQADLVNNSGFYHGRLWSGFAKRGMGCSASSPFGDVAFDVIESFDVPGCATSLGYGGPGNLSLSLCDGVLRVTGAKPLTPVLLVVSLSAVPTPFKGGLLVPLPILLSMAISANASGTLALPVPCGPVAPVPLYLQAIAPDSAQPFGFEISNALQT